jgi:thiosulfate/3-mercaptopyruvate sulfurtransferase
MPTPHRLRPVIEPDELAARQRAEPKRLRVVDARWYLGRPGAGRTAYEAGHIQGAIFLDLDTQLTAGDGPGRHPLPSPTEFRARLEAAGIGSEHDVVAYDDVGGWVAARLWWMLDDLGHEGVAVLDGGYPAWVAGGHPITQAEPSYPMAHLELADAWVNTIAREDMLDRLGEVVLLDARGEPRYRGEIEPVDPLPGHIPTAINAPTDGNLGPDGRMLDPGALAERFRAMGADGSIGPVVTSCGSGVSACLNSLAMRVAGLPDPILYPGSYSDWSRAGLPVAVGPEPGGVPETLRRTRQPR